MAEHFSLVRLVIAMEVHPRVNSLNQKNYERRIILGSFPTWALTACDPEKNETELQKEQTRKKNNDQLYFYGSSRNLFWSWYQEFIDPTISINTPISIDESLKSKSIAITDVILQCKRIGKSSLDKHLKERIYNHQFFDYPGKGEVLKILCTSKGVMNEMLLNKQFFNLHKELYLDEETSAKFQNDLIGKINGDTALVKNSFFISIACKAGGTIECMATPSPGSPFRKLDGFGKSHQTSKAYLNNYLNKTFEWFNS
jgi:hypothetical protein